MVVIHQNLDSFLESKTFLLALNSFCVYVLFRVNLSMFLEVVPVSNNKTKIWPYFYCPPTLTNFAFFFLVLSYN